MDQRLHGWKLALALFIPAAIIGVAGFVAYGALSDDSPEVATGNEGVVATQTGVPTSSPETQPVDPTTVAGPAPTPTALTVPDPAPAPAATAVPATTTPTATAVPTTPPGPAPTATPDPSTATVSCSGVPATADTDQTFGPLVAVTVPPEAAAGFQFTWNFGNGTLTTSPVSGDISYTQAGTYTITLAGTNATTGATLSATCGTVTVAEVVATLQVACSVSSVDTQVELAAARAGDVMRVTTTWTPADVPLRLQYEFEPTDDLIIIGPATTGDTQTNAFGSDDGVFSIFWRYVETGETGRLTCPAYPGSEPAPSPTATLAQPPPPPPRCHRHRHRHRYGQAVNRRRLPVARTPIGNP